MPQIPNTNLTLSEAEIQAVIEYYIKRDTGGSYTTKEEFKMPEEYKNTIFTGATAIKRFKELYGDNPPAPKYYTPVNNEVI